MWSEGRRLTASADLVAGLVIVVGHVTTLKFLAADFFPLPPVDMVDMVPLPTFLPCPPLRSLARLQLTDKNYLKMPQLMG